MLPRKKNSSYVTTPIIIVPMSWLTLDHPPPKKRKWGGRQWIFSTVCTAHHCIITMTSIHSAIVAKHWKIVAIMTKLLTINCWVETAILAKIITFIFDVFRSFSFQYYTPFQYLAILLVVWIWLKDRPHIH